mgnify:FL=1
MTTNPSQQISSIVDRHRDIRGGLIAILEAIQDKFSYLPEDALRQVSQETGKSLVDIYGVATFYKAFSLEPRGEHLVSCCLGTACHVRGGPAIAEELMNQLGVKAGGTTPDKVFTLETVACLGACALGPIVVIDGHYFSNVQPHQVEGILARAREGIDKVEISTDERVFPLDVACTRCNHSLIDTDTYVDGHPSIRVVMSFARKHGSLRLSALYGSTTFQSDHEIPIDTVVDFFCPHCHGQLGAGSECIKCAAPMIPMSVRGGGMLQVCSRRGCSKHRLDLDGANV